MPVFELIDVQKRYESNVVLSGLNLEIAEGRTIVLLGPSGCGKSTLIRLLIGLITPDSGEVRFEGHRLLPKNFREIRRRMGYVIQDGGLFPHMTARANASLPACELGWNHSRIESRLHELIELARLPVDVLDRYPSELSGGQRQRVGLMRALMLDPGVLLLDEPLGALDPLVRADLQDDLLSAFRSLRKTVVLVTHDLAEAALLGDRLVLLNEGRIVQDGSIDDFLQRPADPFVQRFIDAQRGLDRGVRT